MPSPLLESLVGDGDRRVALGELLRGRAGVLVFLRHFACPSCSRTVHAFLDRAGEIEALGARLVLVGLGGAAATERFGGRAGLLPSSADLVRDESGEVHRAAGALRSKASTFGPRAFLRSISLYLGGHYVKRHPDDGDLEQQAAVLVVDDRGEELLRHAARFVGDDVDPNEVLGALLRWRAGKAPFGT